MWPRHLFVTITSQPFATEATCLGLYHFRMLAAGRSFEGLFSIKPLARGKPTKEGESLSPRLLTDMLVFYTE